MSDPTREEFDAKLEAVEARLETRLVGIEGKIDRLFDRVEISVQQSREAREAANETKRATTSIKWNILFTALGVVAVMIAFWGVTLQVAEYFSSVLSQILPPSP